MNLGNWQLDTVDGGDFSIDGGVLYGIVPKVLWQRITPTDENNRLRVRCNCILARDGRHTILIDTGYGGKAQPLDRDFWEMEPGEPLLHSLGELGVSPEEIDAVLFTHLHFDHIGGASRYDHRGRAVLTFPRARHVAGRLEWEDATCRSPELAPAYPLDSLRPLAESGIVETIENNAEVLPGVRVRLTGGHTRGHLGVAFQSNGQTAFFLGDFCPTTAHLHPSWSLAYDTHPLETRRAKPQLLGEAADANWYVLWAHDPKVAVSRIERRGARNFRVVDSQPRL